MEEKIQTLRRKVKEIQDQKQARLEQQKNISHNRYLQVDQSDSIQDLAKESFDQQFMSNHFLKNREEVYLTEEAFNNDQVEIALSQQNQFKRSMLLQSQERSQNSKIEDEVNNLQTEFRVLDQELQSEFKEIMEEILMLKEENQKMISSKQSQWNLFEKKINEALMEIEQLKFQKEQLENNIKQKEQKIKETNLEDKESEEEEKLNEKRQNEVESQLIQAKKIHYQQQLELKNIEIQLQNAIEDLEDSNTQLQNQSQVLSSNEQKYQYLESVKEKLNDMEQQMQSSLEVSYCNQEQSLLYKNKKIEQQKKLKELDKNSQQYQEQINKLIENLESNIQQQVNSKKKYQFTEEESIRFRIIQQKLEQEVLSKIHSFEKKVSEIEVQRVWLRRELIKTLIYETNRDLQISSNLSQLRNQKQVKSQMKGQDKQISSVWNQENLIQIQSLVQQFNKIVKSCDFLSHQFQIPFAELTNENLISEKVRTCLSKINKIQQIDLNTTEQHVIICMEQLKKQQQQVQDKIKHLEEQKQKQEEKIQEIDQEISQLAQTSQKVKNKKDQNSFRNQVSHLKSEIKSLTLQIREKDNQMLLLRSQNDQNQREQDAKISNNDIRIIQLENQLQKLKEKEIEVSSKNSQLKNFRTQIKISQTPTNNQLKQTFKLQTLSTPQSQKLRYQEQQDQDFPSQSQIRKSELGEYSKKIQNQFINNGPSKDNQFVESQQLKQFSKQQKFKEIQQILNKQLINKSAQNQSNINESSLKLKSKLRLIEQKFNIIQKTHQTQSYQPSLQQELYSQQYFDQQYMLQQIQNISNQLHEVKGQIQPFDQDISPRKQTKEQILNQMDQITPLKQQSLSQSFNDSKQNIDKQTADILGDISGLSHSDFENPLDLTPQQDKFQDSSENIQQEFILQQKAENQQRYLDNQQLKSQIQQHMAESPIFKLEQSLQNLTAQVQELSSVVLKEEQIERKDQQEQNQGFSQNRSQIKGDNQQLYLAQNQKQSQQKFAQIEQSLNQVNNTQQQAPNQNKANQIQENQKENTQQDQQIAVIAVNNLNQQQIQQLQNQQSDSLSEISQDIKKIPSEQVSSQNEDFYNLENQEVQKQELKTIQSQETEQTQPELKKQTNEEEEKESEQNQDSQKNDQEEESEQEEESQQEEEDEDEYEEVNEDEEQKQERKEEEKKQSNEDKKKVRFSEELEQKEIQIINKCISAGVVNFSQLNEHDQQFFKQTAGLLIGLNSYKKISTKTKEIFDPLIGLKVVPEQCGYQLRKYQLNKALDKLEQKFIDKKGGDPEILVISISKIIVPKTSIEIIKQKRQLEEKLQQGKFSPMDKEKALVTYQKMKKKDPKSEAYQSLIYYCQFFEVQLITTKNTKVDIVTTSINDQNDWEHGMNALIQATEKKLIKKLKGYVT